MIIRVVIRRLFAWFLICNHLLLSIQEAVGQEIFFDLKKYDSEKYYGIDKPAYLLSITTKDPINNNFTPVHIQITKDKDNTLKILNRGKNDRLGLKITPMRKQLYLSYKSSDHTSSLGFFVDQDGSFILNNLQGQGQYHLSTFDNITLKAKTFHTEFLSLTANSLRNNSNLHVNKLRLKATHQDTEKSLITNAPTAVIHAGSSIKVDRGKLVNQGGIRGNANLKINMAGNDLENLECQSPNSGVKVNGRLQLKNVSHLKNKNIIQANTLHLKAQTLTNRKDIVGESVGKITVSEKLKNRGFMGSYQPEGNYRISSHLLIENYGLMHASFLKVKAVELQNYDQIKALNSLQLLGKAHTYQNTISLPDSYNDIKETIINCGLIDCINGALSVQGQSFINNHTVTGKVTTLNIEKLFKNFQLISGANMLSVTTEELLNWGTLNSKDTFILTKKRFHNLQLIKALNKLTLDTYGIAVNKGGLICENNKGKKPSSSSPLEDNVPYNIHLIVRGIFSNHSANWQAQSILIEGLQQLLPEQEGIFAEFINYADIKSAALSLKNLQKITNRGTLQGDKLEVGFITGLVNHHKILGKKGYIKSNHGTLINHKEIQTSRINTYNLQNLATAKVHASKLSIHQGINEGTINLEALDIKERMVNKYLLESESILTISGSGELENQNSLSARKALNLDTLKRLINKGDIESKKGTWNIDELLNEKDISFKKLLNISTSKGINTGNLHSLQDMEFEVRAFQDGRFINHNSLQAESFLKIKSHGFFDNHGQVNTANQLILSGQGTIDNQGEIKASRDLKIDEAANFINNEKGKLLAPNIIGSKSGFINKGDAIASTSLELSNLQNFENHRSGYLFSQGTMIFNTLTHATNHGCIESLGKLSLGNTLLTIQKQSSLLARNGLMLDDKAVITNSGLVATQGTLEGYLNSSLSQNIGLWSHIGVVNPYESTLTLSGETDWQAPKEANHPPLTQDQLSSLPLNIINQGTAVFRNGGIKTASDIILINNDTLRLSHTSSHLFQSLTNNKDLILETNEEDTPPQQWSIQTTADGKLGFIPGALEAGSLSTAPQFFNNGTLKTTATINYNLKESLGGAIIGRDLTYHQPRALLSDLPLIQCQGIVTATIEGTNESHKDLNMKGINHLNLTFANPMTLSGKWTVPALTINTPTLLILGIGLDNFAHLQTTQGNLVFNVGQIKGTYAKLDAKGDLLGTASSGPLNFGGFIEVAPDGTAYLGPWKGGNAVNDAFQATGINTYRKSNGTLLHADGRIHLKSPQTDLAYCTLDSNLETQLDSYSPLRLRSVILQGQSGFTANAPEIVLDYEGMGKALLAGTPFMGGRGLFKGCFTVTPYTAYDYLLSTPTSLLYQGDVNFNTNKIKFIGTSIEAAATYINGQLYASLAGQSYAQLIPIILGEANYNHKYHTYHHVEKTRRKLRRGFRHGRVNHYRDVTFSYVAQDLSPHFGLSPFIDKNRFFGGLYSGEFKVPNATVAEIDYLGRHRSAMGAAQQILAAHQTGIPVTGCVGTVLVPRFTIGNQFSTHLSSVTGQLQLDSQQTTLTTDTTCFSNSASRTPDRELTPLDINLAHTPQAETLDYVQSTLGRPLEGIRLLPEDLPIVHDKNTLCKPLLRHTLHVPVNLVFMATMARHAKRVHYRKKTGKELLSCVLSQAKRLREIQGKEPLEAIHHSQILKMEELIPYFKPKESDAAEADIFLHIPVHAQNRYDQAGDMVQDVLEEKSTQDTTHNDQRIVVKERGDIQGNNVTLASTAKKQTANNKASEYAHAPMIALVEEGATLKLKANDTSRLKGAFLVGDGQVTNEAGCRAETTALRMRDEENQSHGRTRTDTTTGHHLISGIHVTHYREVAPEHLHEGTEYNAMKNVFEGNNIAAHAVVDYKDETTRTSKTSTLGRTTTRTTTTHTPVGASVPTYLNETVLNVRAYGGEGSSFNGVTHDNTESFHLRPVILTAWQKMQENSNWLGLTKGVKVDQGQESIINPRLQGTLWSSNQPDTQGIMKLTSAILELEGGGIDKVLRQDTYTPKSWNIQKQTGNVQYVAPAVALIVTVATMGTGATLVPAAMQSVMVNAMANAAFTGLCAQAASSFVSNMGDMGKVTQDLLSTRTLKNLTINVATAGLMQHLQGAFPFLQEAGSLQQRLLYNVVKGGIKLNIEAALNGGSYKKLAASEGLTAVVNSMHGYFAYGIGDWLDTKAIDSFTHKVLHGALGALANEAVGNSALAGALGAMVAETVAEVSEKYAQAKLEEKILKRFEQEARWLEEDSAKAGIRLSDKERAQYHQKIRTSLQSDLDKGLADIRSNSANLGRYAAIAAAVIAKQDPNAVYNAANTALTENFVKHGLKALRIAGLALSGYEIVDAYMVEGPEAALYKLGEIGLITVAIGVGGKITYEIGGVACQNAARAWDLACKQYPALWKITQTIYQSVGAVKNSGVYQQGAALVDKGVAAVTNNGVYQKVANNKVVQGVVKVIDTADSLVDGAMQLGGKVATKGIKYLTGGGVKPAAKVRVSIQGSEMASSSSEINSISSVAATPSALQITAQGVPNAGGYINSFITTQEEIYYRVYAENRIMGRFITKTPPKSSALAQEGLALPASNTAEFVQEVVIPAGTRLQRSRALPAFDKRGGFEQFQILENDLSNAGIIFKEGKKLQ